ncbi:hypothetical protein ACQUQU_04085 [Thalassolituus sp. LLYu03]|uniref:hypothetical protein n=1 Tax=Thalassolituus sp. LLYu03 TaxID=3421656 RepID=UPI003D2CF85F
MSHQKLSLIHPLVEHLMKQQDIGEWRSALIENGIMTREEVIALDHKALEACYKTFKTMQLLHCDADHILSEIERNQVCWRVDLSEDYRHGVVCY